MKNLRTLLPLLLTLTCAPSPAFAGSYGLENFNSFDVGATDLGGGALIAHDRVAPNASFASIQNRPGSTTDRAVRLTQDSVQNGIGSFLVPVLDTNPASGTIVGSFDVTFKVRQFSADPLAEGFSFNFGAIPGGADLGGGEIGFTMPNGLVISFDTFDNSGTGLEAPRIKVFANGIQVGSVGVAFAVNDNTFHNVVIHWDSAGLDLSYDGVVRFNNLQLRGFDPATGDRFAFTGRTGLTHQDTMIDDLQITTTPLPPLTTSDVVITEFVADNGDGIEDEDEDTSDWLELYNGTSTAVDLNGWRLTNISSNLGLWTLPAVTLPPLTYLRIFASGKDRANPAGVLHTNFTIEKSGGYLALVKPDGVTKTSEFNYGQQSEDVSFGTYGAAQTLQYLFPPTPERRNEGNLVLHADGRPAEEVVFSRDGGLITGPVALSVAAPLEAGAVIRYTIDGTIPDAADPIFDPATPLNITTTRNVRARVFMPGRLPGDVSSRVFLLLDASLTNYGNTGQPFSSNLPIIVVESFGVNIDAVTNPGGLRPYRPVYSVAFDRDPANGNRASLNGLVDFQGRGGMHVRGQTSSSFGQKPFAWEIWTNEDDDKSVPLLGFPSDSDWVLQTPYNDKSIMRNTLPYDTMRETNGTGSAVGSRFVEVFFNQDGGPISYADYRGVYVLMERIKRGSERIDISKLNRLATDPAVITGGYIFKKDKVPVQPLFQTTSTGAWGTQLREITEPEDASPLQVNYLRNYVQQFDNALTAATYADPAIGYKAFIEPQTFMDNHLWVEAFKQIDGYRLSTYFTKDRGQKIRAFPIWDYNLSGGNANYLEGFNPAGWYYTLVGAADYPYYSRLFQDTDFRLKYADRYWQMRRTLFTTSALLARIDAHANELTDNNYATNVVNGALINTGGGEFFPTNKGNNLPPSLETPARVENPAMRHFDRWPILGIHVWPNPAGSNTRTTYQSEITWMKNWFTNRLAWMDTQFTRPPTFSHPGGNVAAGTTLAITNPNASGTIFYTTDGTDPYAPNNSPENILAGGDGAACQWIVPSAANGGTTLTAGAGPEQWTAPADPPNIANWTTGTTGIGYDLAPTPVNFLPHIGTNANTQTQMFNTNRTAYLRVLFTIPDQAALDAIGTLLLNMKYADGFRAYLNGTIVHGRNDTHASVTTTPASAQATTSRADAEAVIFESSDITAIGKPALRIGQNVLAIHGLNALLGSADFLISPRLGFQPPPEPGTGPRMYAGPLTLDNSTTVRSRVLIGTTWGPITEASFVVNALPAAASNLVVSEFCYNPQASGIYLSKDLEFLVLRNISASNVDLTGVQLAAGVIHTLTGSVDTLTLPPGGEVVIAANPTALVAVHGVPPAGVRLFGPFDGALDNSGETLSVRTASNAVIKEFTYSTLAPWPDAAGRCLVLEHPSANPNHEDGHNWRLGAAIRGTPYSSDSVAFTGTWLADTDLDGFSDGAEYTLGTSATDPSSAPQIVPTVGPETVAAVEGTYLRLTFQRSLANDSATLIPELSGDLVNWTSGTAAFTRMSQTIEGGDLATEVWRTTSPVTGSQAFARLRILAP